jgi:hypothetical protein
MLWCVGEFFGYESGARFLVDKERRAQHAEHRVREMAMTSSKKLGDELDPKAKGRKTSQADFDRNRDGMYGGLPKARDPHAPGPGAKKPHPPKG